jgi:hypothetical protein
LTQRFLSGGANGCGGVVIEVDHVRGECRGEVACC